MYKKKILMKNIIIERNSIYIKICYLFNNNKNKNNNINNKEL